MPSTSVTEKHGPPGRGLGDGEGLVLGDGFGVGDELGVGDVDAGALGPNPGALRGVIVAIVPVESIVIT